MKKVYTFTNENVTSFESLYDFKGAKVLSVVGSGDQYFASRLFGAEEIELYDVNYLAWDYFVLKFYGIIHLSYDEFFEYFVTKKLNDLNYFMYLKPYLPFIVASTFANLYRKHKNISYLFNYTNIASINYEDGQIIPYFDRENYYKLQELLKNSPLPTFHLTDFRNLPKQLANKSYDIILASNIFYWLYDKEEDRIQKFLAILNSFNFKVIQAIYDYYLMNYEKEIKQFEEYGFLINQVPSSNVLKLFPDTVISYRR